MTTYGKGARCEARALLILIDIAYTQKRANHGNDEPDQMANAAATAIREAASREVAGGSLGR
jgi:hypothetical protein